MQTEALTQVFVFSRNIVLLTIQNKTTKKKERKKSRHIGIQFNITITFSIYCCAGHGRSPYTYI